MHCKKSGLYERHAKIACTKRKKAQKLSPSLAPRDTWKFLATLQKREHQNAYSMRHQSHQSRIPSSIYTSILGSTHAHLFPKAQCREKCEKVEKGALKIECTGTVNTANSERDWSSPQNGWASCSSETMLTPAVTMTLSP